jgi:hypothetical protein
MHIQHDAACYLSIIGLLTAAGLLNTDNCNRAVEKCSTVMVGAGRIGVIGMFTSHSETMA